MIRTYDKLAMLEWNEYCIRNINRLIELID